MNFKIKLLIFDWAGTAIDFGSCAPVEAFLKAFQSFNLNPTPEEIRKPMGVLKWNHIQEVFKMENISKQWHHLHHQNWTDEDVDKVYKKSEEEIFKILKDFTDPKPYVLETVKKIRERGIKIGSTTGYTDEMMEIVTQAAKEKGYAPDYWCTPNKVNNLGRPYPFMIFENMKQFQIPSVKNVLKVGDTLADIKEGLAAGVISVGIIDGSSLMGLSQVQFNQLSEDEKNNLRQQVKNKYLQAKANYIINDVRELPELINKIENN